MKLKPIKRRPLLKATQTAPEEEKKKKTRSPNTLPPDVYEDEIDPIDVAVDDSRKIVLSVKRGGELGLPMCDIRQFQTTEVYTGFTKKGINIPLEVLPDLIELLQVVYQDCEEKKLV